MPQIVFDVVKVVIVELRNELNTLQSYPSFPFPRFIFDLEEKNFILESEAESFMYLHKHDYLSKEIEIIIFN